MALELEVALAPRGGLSIVSVWVWSFVSGDMRGGFGPSSLLI